MRKRLLFYFAFLISIVSYGQGSQTNTPLPNASSEIKALSTGKSANVKVNSSTTVNNATTTMTESGKSATEVISTTSTTASTNERSTFGSKTATVQTNATSSATQVLMNSTNGTAVTQTILNGVEGSTKITSETADSTNEMVIAPNLTRNTITDLNTGNYLETTATMDSSKLVIANATDTLNLKLEANKYEAFVKDGFNTGLQNITSSGSYLSASDADYLTYINLSTTAFSAVSNNGDNATGINSSPTDVMLQATDQTNTTTQTILATQSNINSTDGTNTTTETIIPTRHRTIVSDGSGNETRQTQLGESVELSFTNATVGTVAHVGEDYAKLEWLEGDNLRQYFVGIDGIYSVAGNGTNTTTQNITPTNSELKSDLAGVYGRIRTFSGSVDIMGINSDGHYASTEYSGAGMNTEVNNGTSITQTSFTPTLASISVSDGTNTSTTTVIANQILEQIGDGSGDNSLQIIGNIANYSASITDATNTSTTTISPTSATTVSTDNTNTSTILSEPNKVTNTAENGSNFGQTQTAVGFVSIESATSSSDAHVKVEPTQIEYKVEGALVNSAIVQTSGNITTTADEIWLFAGASGIEASNTAIDITGTNVRVNSYEVFRGLSGSSTLNFPSTNTQSSSDLTFTVSGASVNDPVSLGIPPTAISNPACGYVAWVSAANTVTVRFNNFGLLSIDPASATFTITIKK